MLNTILVQVAVSNTSFVPVPTLAFHDEDELRQGTIKRYTSEVSQKAKTSAPNSSILNFFWAQQILSTDVPCGLLFW